MVLVDTSVWISHLRYGNPHLKELLLEEAVICHPFIIGELACGRIANRNEILSLLHALPKARIVANDEVLLFIEKNSLVATGLGLIDVHLLASSRLSQALLWTDDSRLKKAAATLGMKYK